MKALHYFLLVVEVTAGPHPQVHKMNILQLGALTREQTLVSYSADVFRITS